MSDRVETARITIIRTISDAGDDSADIIHTEFEGDAERAICALGMLAMAEDGVLHGGEQP